MANAEVLRDQPILSLDEVVVDVLWKRRSHSIRRLARFSVSDGVRQYDVIPARIQGLPRTEQFAAKRRCKHGSAGLSGAMQDENWLACRRPYGLVVDAKLGQDFAGQEPEVTNDPIALFLRGEVRGKPHDSEQRQSDSRGKSEQDAKEHLSLLWLRRRSCINQGFGCEPAFASNCSSAALKVSGCWAIAKWRPGMVIN